MPVCPLLLGNDPDKNCSPGEVIIYISKPESPNSSQIRPGLNQKLYHLCKIKTALNSKKQKLFKMLNMQDKF